MKVGDLKVTEQDFINEVYNIFSNLKSFSPKTKLEDGELLWISAMRCALLADRKAVADFCAQNKPYTLDKQSLYKYQFNIYRKIALGRNDIKELEPRLILDQFTLKKKKERKK